MERYHPCRVAAVLLVLAGPAAGAEGHHQPKPEKPVAEQAPRAPAPVRSPGAHASVLEEYRPYRADEPLADWRQLNDEVGRLGGHVGHSRPPGPGAAPHAGH